MVSKRFSYSTTQVKNNFATALSSDGAAAAQAQLFKLANQGRLKPRAWKVIFTIIINILLFLVLYDILCVYFRINVYLLVVNKIMFFLFAFESYKIKRIPTFIV